MMGQMYWKELNSLENEIVQKIGEKKYKRFLFLWLERDDIMDKKAQRILRQASKIAEKRMKKAFPDKKALTAC